MSTIIKTFRKVLGSGSAEQLTTQKIHTQGFSVRSEIGNADIYIGDSTATSSTGMFIKAGESNEKYAKNIRGGAVSLYDLSKVYIVGSSGNAVRVEYESEG